LWTNFLLVTVPCSAVSCELWTASVHLWLCCELWTAPCVNWKARMTSEWRTDVRCFFRCSRTCGQGKAETWNGQPKGQNKKRNWLCKSHELPLCCAAKIRKKFISKEANKLIWKSCSNSGSIYIIMIFEYLKSLINLSYLLWFENI
jgi:hypothetical protein